ncbi:hypothetical protein ACFC09_05785 [Streptomyces sp. NPDC056161]|uniref:hypothetical protein n=1 Tax=Streptomyces sp. NPDC056161 TaxID=3345732 RepID=UPI0035E076C9
MTSVISVALVIAAGIAAGTNPLIAAGIAAGTNPLIAAGMAAGTNPLIAAGIAAGTNALIARQWPLMETPSPLRTREDRLPGAPTPRRKTQTLTILALR